MAEMEIGHLPDLIPDVINLGAQIAQQRKGILREKEHFKHAIQGVIRHAKDILIKKGKMAAEMPKEVPKMPLKTEFVGDLSSISSQLGFEMSKSESPKLPPVMTQEMKKAEKSGVFSPDLSKLADLNISAHSTSPKKKITKADFTKAKGIKQDTNPDDPLSQLDPLWSLK